MYSYDYYDASDIPVQTPIKRGNTVSLIIDLQRCKDPAIA